MGRLKEVTTIVFLLLFSFRFAVAAEIRLPVEKAYAEIKFAPQELKNPGWHLGPIPSSWKVINLDGLWKLKRFSRSQVTIKRAPTPWDNNPTLYNGNPLNGQGMKKGYFGDIVNDSTWQDFPVPWSWSYTYPEAGKSWFDGVGWYRREFNLPSEWKERGKRVLLKFEGVNWQTDVWINGKTVGRRHIGGNAAFSYDITSWLREGKNNISVRVYTHTGNNSYPGRVRQGIWQPVRLFLVPEFYAPRILITPDIHKSEIEIKAFVKNPLPGREKIKIRAKIVPLGVIDKGKVKPGKAQLSLLGKYELNPGINKFNFKVKINNLNLWSPDKPFLYLLTLYSNKGALGMVRFGMREFSIREGHFYLNGKRTRLMPLEFNTRLQLQFVMRHYHTMDGNDNSFLKRALLSLKKMGFNIVRPHCWYGMQTTNFFNLADEVGLMVYDEWVGSAEPNQYGYGGHYTHQDKALAMSLDEYKNWVYFRYNHPSLVIWDFGNEIYEQGNAIVKVLDKYYETVKSIDKQDRPVVSSSGRQSLGALKSGRIKEKLDFVDDHQYGGFTFGSWELNKKHYLDYKKEVESIYGKNKKPMVAMEYARGGGDFRYRGIDYRPVFDKSPMSLKAKKIFIKDVQSKRAEVGGYIRLVANFAGFRIYATNEAKLRRWDAYDYKRVMGIIRRGQILEGASTNAQWTHMAIPTLGSAEPAFQENRRYAPHIPYSTTEDNFVASPLFYAARRVNSPEFISLGFFNKDLFAGGELSLSIYAVNDLPEAANNYSGIIQLRDTSGKLMHQEKIKIGKILPMNKKVIPYRYKLSPGLPTGFYKIDLYLFKGNKRVSDNWYRFFVLSKKAMLFKNPGPKVKIALYDSAGTVFAGLGISSTTTKVLNSLPIKYSLIKNFKGLNKYQVLILGANSVDGKVIQSSERIRNWIEKGGRVLSFSQVLSGSLPFLSETKIVAGGGGTFSEMVEPTSPIFKGLVQKNFDTWDDDAGFLYKFALSPLNVTALSVGPTNIGRDPKSIKMIMSDSRVGKGEVVLSQFLLTKRYHKDSVATKLTNNLLEYIIRPTHPELVFNISGKKGKSIPYLSQGNAYFVNLRNYVNRGFRDNIAGDKKGGWTDFGPAADFRDIPTGIQRFNGGVPFEIINPAKNNGVAAIVLKGTGAKNKIDQRPYFPQEIKGIKINRKLDKLYFLQTSMYTVGNLILTYRIHYQDKKTLDIRMRNGIDLGDDYHPKDLPNGIVAFRNRNGRGLYLSQWLNPRPDKTIESLDIISAGETIPIVVAITGKLRYSNAGVRGR